MRKKEIDYLRGLAMIGMMIIHSCAYFLNDKLIYKIWDFFQWAVPVFIFCSFYLIFSNKNKTSFNLKKRIKRLYLPYFYFLIIYFFLLFFFEKNKFNLNYFLANIFLYGGIDFNWLVLLFIYLSFLTPFFLWIKKRKVIFYSFLIISFLSSIIFIFYNQINFRIIMWLTWMILVYFSYFFVKNEKNKFFIYKIILTSLIIFILTYFLEIKINHNLSQFSNKYPPTIYHLSYGIFWITILFSLAKKQIFNFYHFERLLNFLSVNSYSLYFIHALIIHILVWTKSISSLGVINVFLIIFLGSLLINKILNKLLKIINFNFVKIK